MLEEMLAGCARHRAVLLGTAPSALSSSFISLAVLPDLVRGR
jgi:hypothetical protein